MLRLIIVAIMLWGLPLASNPSPLNYRHFTKGTSLSAHILEVNPKDFTFVLARALNNGLGRETVSSIAKRKGAAAAINGGYFMIGGTYDGMARGVLKIGGNWVAAPRMGRGAIGWDNGGGAAISRLQTSVTLTIGDKIFPVDNFNVPRGGKEAVLYTGAFHPSTLTFPEGTEIAIQDGKILSVHKGKGDTPLPYRGFVYSVDHLSPVDLKGVAAGAPVDVAFHVKALDREPGISPTFWDTCNNIVGGAGMLLHNGEISQTFQEEGLQGNFIETKMPRTAVGIKPDGVWVFVVVDGRQPMLSEGLTLHELAAFMRSLGCVQALNLDGGGSSTMVVEGNIVNSPVGEAEDTHSYPERRVSDAILIFRRHDSVERS